MDSTVGDDRKSSKLIDANVSKFKFFEAKAGVSAMNDEAFALAA